MSLGIRGRKGRREWQWRRTRRKNKIFVINSCAFIYFVNGPIKIRFGIKSVEMIAANFLPNP